MKNHNPVSPKTTRWQRLATSLLSLRSKLVIAFLLVALTPLVLDAWYDRQLTETLVTDAAQQTLSIAANEIASSLDDFLLANTTILNTFAGMPQVIDYIVSPPGMRPGAGDIQAMMLTIHNSSSYVRTMALLNDEGQVLIVSTTAVGFDVGLSKQNQPYFQYPLVTGQRYISNVVPLDRGEGLYFSTPINNLLGEPMGVLVVVYQADVLQQVLEQSTTLTERNIFWALFDNQQKVIGSTDPRFDLETETLEANLTQKNPFFTVADISPSQEVYQVAVQPLTVRPWQVAFFQPQAEFLAPVDSEIRRNLWRAVLFSLMVMVVAVIAGQALAAPVRHLTHAMTRFTEGHLDARATITPLDEVGTLARSFNEMAEQVGNLLTRLAERKNSLEVEINERRLAEQRLQAYQEQLETLVDERTRELREERNLLRTMIDNIPVGIHVKNRKLEFILNNRASIQGLHRTDQTDLLGKTDFDVFPQWLATEVHADEQHIIETGEPMISKEVQLVTDAEGEDEQRWVLATKVPLRDSEGQITGLVGISHDVTDYKKASALIEALLEQEKQQRQIAESLQQIANTLNRTLDKEVVLNNLFTELKKVLAYDGAGLFLQRDDTLVVTDGIGTGREFIGLSVPLESHNPAVRVFRQQKALSIANVAQDTDWIVWSGGEQIQSWMGAPLLAGEQTIGILTLDSFQAAAYGQTETEILQAFATQAATAIRNAQIYAEAQREKLFLETLITNSPEATVIVDGAYTVLSWNPAAERLFGYSEAEAVGQNIYDLVTTNDIRTSAQQYGYKVAQTFHNVVTQRRRKDGSLVDVEVLGVPVITDETQKAILVLYHDITSIKQAERIQALLYRLADAASAVTDLPAFYRTVHEIVAELMTAKNFYLTTYNQETQRLIFSYWVNQFEDTVPESVAVSADTLVGEIVRTRQPVLMSWQAWQADKQTAKPISPMDTVPLYWLGAPLLSDEEPLGAIVVQSYDEGAAYSEADKANLVFVAQHISTALQRIRLAQETRQRVAELTTINRISRAISSQLHLESLLHLVGQRLLQTFTVETVYIMLSHATTTEGNGWFVEGAAIACEPNSFAATLSDKILQTGQPLFINQNVAQYYHSLRTTPEPSAERLPQAYLGVPILAKEKGVGVLGVQTMAAEGHFTEGDVRLLTTIATHLGIAIRNARSFEAEQAAKRSLEQTLEKLTTTQNELVQSEKMAALGQLIAGVAHEINTPLGAIQASIGNISDSLTETIQTLPDIIRKLSSDEQTTLKALLKRAATSGQSLLSAREERQHRRQIRRILESHEVAKADQIADMLIDMGVVEDVEPFLPLLQSPYALESMDTAYKLARQRKNSDNINMAVGRASKIVFALKNYARRDHSGEKVLTHVRETIETVLTIYHNQLKQGIDVVRDYQDVPAIYCYPDELNQVWTNLIYNALQAMEYDGSLVITIRQPSADEATTAGSDWIIVTMTDSGPGIPDEIKERIFEPFFTTKPVGEGSGLGLDIVRRIVHKHEGNITVQSEPGRTAFSIWLPIMEPER